jgi:hypothetical protein
VSRDVTWPVPARIFDASHLAPADEVEARARSVRLYHESPGSYALQIRAPLQLRSGKDSKSFMIAHANLSVEVLSALRLEIERHLSEAAAGPKQITQSAVGPARRGPARRTSPPRRR